MSRTIEIKQYYVEPLDYLNPNESEEGQSTFLDLSSGTDELDSSEPGASSPLGIIEYTVADINEAKRNGIGLIELFDSNSVMTPFMDLAMRLHALESMIVMFTVMKHGENMCDQELQSAVDHVAKKHQGKNAIVAMCTYIPNTLRHLPNEAAKTRFLESMDFILFPQTSGEPGKVYWRESVISANWKKLIQKMARE